MNKPERTSPIRMVTLPPSATQHCVRPQMRALVLLTVLLGLWTNVMAYSLHIIDISASESDWVEFVNNSPDLELIHTISGNNPKTKETISIGIPNSARTTSGTILTPMTHDGKLVISVGNPDDQTIAFMKKIAVHFGGEVVGDNGETY